MTQIVFTKIMNPSENLRRRSDLSPYLFHFTKDNGGRSAKEIIASIVEETKLPCRIRTLLGLAMPGGLSISIE